MIRNLPLLLLASFCFSGCASKYSDLRVNEWVGRITFNGEFAIDVAGSATCVSGSLPLSEQVKAKQLEGRTVIVSGRAVAWPSDPLIAYLDNEGSRITNDCGANYVIFAEYIKDLT